MTSLGKGSPASTPKYSNEEIHFLLFINANYVVKIIDKNNSLTSISLRIVSLDTVYSCSGVNFDILLLFVNSELIFLLVNSYIY